MRLGVYIGSFNPPHIGHKYVIDYLLNNNLVDKIIIIPTMNYWNKKDLINVKDRINMLRFYENENIKINDSLNNIEYTYQILEILKKQYINDELLLILGADNIQKLYLWKNIEQILKNKIIVLNRDNIEIEHYINKYVDKNNFIYLNDFENINISSSIIRNNLEKNKSFLDKEIYNYIKSNKLYK